MKSINLNLSKKVTGGFDNVRMPTHYETARSMGVPHRALEHWPKDRFGNYM